MVETAPHGAGSRVERLPFWLKLGPGILFAAQAVGVSHLVQSTRAGADFGLILAPLVVLACILKYPAFLFSAAYAASTGQSIIASYRAQGVFALFVAALSIMIDMLIATAAVTLVTSGLIKSVLGVPLPDLVMVGIIFGGLVVLFFTTGYALFEAATRYVVILLAVCVLVAAVLTVPLVSGRVGSLVPAIELSQGTLLFVIAMMGWMPSPTSASFPLSAWAAARKQMSGPGYGVRDARFDLNTGYVLIVILALCFVLMGAAMLYGTPGDIAASPVGFAAHFFSLFTTAIGPWAFPIIAVAATAVMLSTVATLLDGMPRAAQRIVGRHDNKKVFRALLLFQVVGATLMIAFAASSFSFFIDFATSTGFVAAPLIAYFNHKAMFAPEIPEADRPSPFMRAWSLLAIGVFAVIAVALFVTRVVL